MAPHSNIYTPLDPERSHIRLVTIHPKDQVSRQIKCDLETYPLDEQLDYEALSYVWGDPGSETEILLNGQVFPVRRNLAFALTDLRLADRPRRLWIDAICINQGDHEERSSQVLLMRQIYQNASRVVILPGNSTPENVSALNLLRSVNEMIPYNEYEMPSQSDLAKVRNYLNTDILANEALACLLFDFLGQAWWERVWVIQEVAVSSKATVVIGDSELEWDSFHQAMLIIVMTGVLPTQPASQIAMVEDTGLRSLLNIEALRRRFKQGSLLSISTLVGCNRQVATDPRDLVYAFLGLAKQSDDPLLTPNYSDAHPASAVFTNLVEYSIRIECSLDIISLSQGKIRKDLPSWCLDWTQPRRMGWEPNQSRHQQGRLARRLGWDFGSDCSGRVPFPLIPTYLFILTNNPWHACGNKSPVARIIRSPLTLACKGLLVDVVEVIGDPLTLESSQWVWNRVMTDLRLWEKLILKHFGGLKIRLGQPADGPSIFDVSDQYHRLVVSLSNHPSFAPWDPVRLGTMILAPLRIMSNLAYSSYRRQQKLHWKIGSLFRGFRFQYITGGPLTEAYVRTLITNRVEVNQLMTDNDYKLFWSKVPKSLGDTVAPDLAPLLKSLVESMIQRICARTLVLTKKGYLGLGPTKARKGDLVCILYGCSVPVIIREHGQGHEFVGESYIHGLMDGAAVNQQSLRDTLEEREFMLV